MFKLLIKIAGHDLGYMKPGVGPNSWAWLRIIFPYQCRFYDSSLNHDRLYSEGGDEEDRQHADIGLLCGMIDACDTMYQRKWAGFYYRMVRKYGHFFFKYKKSFDL